jgi:hypothetical protein
VDDRLETAQAAQKRVNERFGSASWFRGAGLGRGQEQGTFSVEVLVSDKAEAAELPETVDGIEVRAVETGPVRAE